MAFQNFFAAKLFTDIGAGDISITLDTAPVVTSGRMVLEARNPTQREIIKYTGISGNMLTGVSRGQGGTSAKSHLKNALVEMNLTAEDLEDAISVPSTIVQVTNEITMDFVFTGGVIAIVSGLIGSMSDIVYYINGIRNAITSIPNKTYAANKDTYVDATLAGTIVYTEVTNNAASPALASNYIRLGIVVTGASIANASSINQGQPDRVLPIATSQPYQVTDSLGNLICPRDPRRKIIGYRQITYTAIATTIAAITGLSCPVIVPAGRKVKVSVYCPTLYSTTATSARAELSAWDGAVGSGTQLCVANGFTTGGSATTSGSASAIISPQSSTKTYNVGLSATVGTGTAVGSATIPTYILVELE